MKVMLLYLVIGIIIGYISFLIVNPFISTILAVIILFVVPKTFGKILKINEKIRWWLTNGGLVYMFIWFITWAMLLTL